ncbi:TPA: YggS family pyridoxal phosphate-dependent enzyme [Vibrio alginolyticus]|jgi:pyridoxal phosphate enzyme (YggS family)|uniref:YggS family pyridoxal phosphate-dependent enzyme n=1 Tax=Vibrio TaxID=662 RepID=UPI00124CB8F9|nr:MULTISPECIES: YggS family pyridoxal phosphate-dependent enzyme [Vibrio]EGQ9232503.1 YggS family pyridoxal phosphate-dependent enzyme [Vibrio alginolyticus]EGR0708778.1 YggS family pyridoxal phosphate-dependent enzyme [Vibrio alginolyticus]EGR1564576.1 YggS family pyridoxal phosphate-dependent enzyme [Vibrio alginolyticus]EIJ2377625.1 YggS family pyridoxal phosphate-dependent enzyme [Vibrio alginolyticus]EJT1895342.1 YggS family pyridoxal phosphate-dependent enzyme [Vibrio alginolyticus]
MSSIQQNIEHITSQIRYDEQKCGRTPESVQLLAVSKTKPVEAILEAYQAGQTAFGENYVQEGVSKVQHFAEHYPDNRIEWHFIGPIQSNKSRLVAEHFDWVHTIDRTKIAQRLNEQRPSELKPLQVLIQVNTSGEASKSGVTEAEVFELAELISRLPNLTLRGLMSIPANVSDYESQLREFQKLATLKQTLEAQFPEIDTLSMGMSGDMTAAIEAGSTMVRIGTAIFGARDYS